MTIRSLRAGVATAALLSTIAVTHGEEFPSSNVTLLEHVPLGAFPSNPSSGNDCWGYISPGGREYALMGLRNAVAVVDISEASGPVVVGSIDHQSSNWCDIRTFGAHAYAVNETGGGLDVIDLSQVDGGVVTLVQRVTEAGLSTCHNIAVNEDSGHLYLAASNINEGRLVAMSLADPANPVIAGMTPIAGYGVPHDVQVVTYTSGPYAGREIAFASSGTDGLEIYDVTDKGGMFKIADGTYPNEVFTHQAWLSEDRHYLYVNDEADGINETVIMDVSVLETPTYVGAYDSGVEATDHNVFVHQGRIYEAEYRAGLRVFDATDPIAPVQIGWIDTVPEDDAAGSGGAWGTWPFFPSGKVIVSTKDRGLFVVWPDPAPITFAFPGGTPDRVDPDGSNFLVEIQVEPGHTLDPASPVLVYDFGSGPVETSMAPAGGTTWEAATAAIPCGALLEYHVRAATGAGITIRRPANAPCETFQAVSAVDAVTALDDDFEADTGWTVGAPGDTATGGIWTRVTPIGTLAQPGLDHTPGGGTACFVTGQGPVNGGIGDEDVDGGQTTLLSPVLDLSFAQQATIGYWRWYHNSFEQVDSDEGNGPSEDVFRVDVTDDGGATWRPVETVGPTGPGTSGGWALHAFDVGTLVELTTQVQLRFVASDLGALSVVEAAIDDALVVTVTCNDPCPEDLDGNDTVGFADLDLLLAAWGSCPGCPEDLTGDGSVGFADLNELLGAWGPCGF